MKADGSPKLSGNYLNILRIPDSGCFLKNVRCALLLKVFKDFSSSFFYSVAPGMENSLLLETKARGIFRTHVSVHFLDKHVVCDLEICP
jgi:hypothetical protein